MCLAVGQTLVVEEGATLEGLTAILKGEKWFQLDYYDCGYVLDVVYFDVIANAYLIELK